MNAGRPGVLVRFYFAALKSGKTATTGTFRRSYGGAGGARTHDRRIMRSLARRSGRAACADTT